MSLKIASLASSSSGNCYLVVTDSTTILLDCGISVKRIKENLGIKGLELSDIDCVLVTHEHVDHVKSLKTLLKKAPEAVVYASEGTYRGIREKYEDIAVQLVILGDDRVRTVKGGAPFTVGDIEVLPFNVSHDTNEPVAYRFKTEDACVSVVTDTGYVSDEIFEAVKDSDVLVAESNHEPEILLYGRYPYPVKQRILSDYGHLSNEACAGLLAKVLKYREGKDRELRVFLAHLSTENNTPEQAMLTVGNILEEEGFYLGRHYTMETLRKDEASRFIEV